MIELIALSWISLVLYLCFETSAVYEYLRLMSPLLPEWLTRMRGYDETAKPHGIPYGDYRKLMGDSFLMRLITCPVCLGFWLSLGAAWFVDSLLFLPPIYIGSQLLYRLMRDTQHGTAE
jgi:hypothetical protein